MCERSGIPQSSVGLTECHSPRVAIFITVLTALTRFCAYETDISSSLTRSESSAPYSIRSSRDKSLRSLILFSFIYLAKSFQRSEIVAAELNERLPRLSENLPAFLTSLVFKPKLRAAIQNPIRKLVKRGPAPLKLVSFSREFLVLADRAGRRHLQAGA